MSWIVDGPGASQRPATIKARADGLVSKRVVSTLVSTTGADSMVSGCMVSGKVSTATADAPVNTAVNTETAVVGEQAGAG